MEIWKDIPGYEGYYQASNIGNIKSLVFQCNLTHKKYSREKLLKQKIGKDRCKRVELWKEGKHKTWLVHRLIGMTFLGIPSEKLTINHKDGNRLNNKVENLEWCSIKENIRHAFRNNLINSQIKVKIVNKITGTVIFPSSLSEGSKIIGRNYRYISECLRGGKRENDLYKWELV